MKTSRNKSLKQQKSQSNSILTAMRNLNALSESQKKKKEYLSSVVFEIHSSDSDTENCSVSKITVKRKLSFGLMNEEQSNFEPNDKEKRVSSTTSSSAKSPGISANKPTVSSTPLKNVTEVSSSSSFDISSIGIEEGSDSLINITKITSSENICSDSDSDTIILDDDMSVLQNSTTHKKIGISEEDIVIQDTTILASNTNENESTNFQIIEKVIENDIDFSTRNISTDDTMDKPAISQLTVESNSDSLSQTIRPCPRSPSKKIPRKYGNRDTKTINTSYLSALEELFICFENNKHYKNLLAEEIEVLKIFSSSEVDQNYRYICLKLLTWKNKWYNIFKFCEKINLHLENKETIQLYDWLEKSCIVDTDCSKEDLSYLLNLLDLNDIQEIYNKFKLKRANSKEERIKNLVKFCSTQSMLISSKSSKDLLLKEVEKRMGKCIKIRKEFQDSFYNIYLLATFTNTAFSNIGDYFTNIFALKIALPTFKVEEYKMFVNRSEFLSFTKARKYDDDYENAFLNKNPEDALQISEQVYGELVKLENSSEDDELYKDAPHLRRYSAKNVYIRTLSKAVNYLSTKHPVDAKKWLEYMIDKIKSHRIGEWYYLLSWIHMKYLKPPNYEHAAELMIKAVTEGGELLSDLQKLNFKHRSEQICNTKKHKIDELLQNSMAELLPDTLEKVRTTTVDAQTLRSNEMGKKRSYVKKDGEGNKTFMSVENIALDYYINECGYTDGRHCEGAIIQALFALLFWDIIYDPDPPVPGTFLSKIQQVPLDMKTSYFYSNRKCLIDKRLEEISSEWSRDHIMTFLKSSYENHSFEAGICKVDSIISAEEAYSLLEVLVDCIGRSVLSKILQRLVKNVGAYRSGMPDLLIWNADQKTAKFVEVKGEGDRLRPNQELWLSYLQSIGADIEVCHVHSMGSKRKKR